MGVEVYSLEGGILFDNIIMTHSRSTLEAFAAATWEKKHAKEVSLYKAHLEAIGEDEGLFRLPECSPDSLLARACSAIGFDSGAALDCYWREPERFKTEYALPALVFCIGLIVFCTLLRGAAEFVAGRWAERQQKHAERAKAKRLEEAQGFVLPGEIQKTAATLHLPSPKLADSLGTQRRTRMLSSPLQHQSFSAPPTPSHPSAHKTIYQFGDEELERTD